MTSAQVVETSVTNNSSFQNYPHPDDHTIRTTDTPGFKPVTITEGVEIFSTTSKQGRQRFPKDFQPISSIIILQSSEDVLTTSPRMSKNN